MKIKTQDLTGTALDWAVAVAEGKSGDCEIHANNIWYGRVTSGFVQYHPSTNWALMGPIIERELITLDYDCFGPQPVWIGTQHAFDGTRLQHQFGETPLTAAARCYVASKLGDEVEVPEELL